MKMYNNRSNQLMYGNNNDCQKKKSIYGYNTSTYHILRFTQTILIGRKHIKKQQCCCVQIYTYVHQQNKEPFSTNKSTQVYIRYVKYNVPITNTAIAYDSLNDWKYFVE